MLLCGSCWNLWKHKLPKFSINYKDKIFDGFSSHHIADGINESLNIVNVYKRKKEKHFCIIQKLNR